MTAKDIITVGAKFQIGQRVRVKRRAGFWDGKKGRITNIAFYLADGRYSYFALMEPHGSGEFDAEDLARIPETKNKLKGK